jgi:hypothetical protein
VNNKLTVDGIFCVSEKTFCYVSHNILLSKLKFYGIVGKFYMLIKSYVKERYQRVLIDNENTHNSTSSTWEEVKLGAPQSLNLGSLFLLFSMNDLPKITTKNVKFILYADNTSRKVK